MAGSKLQQEETVSRWQWMLFVVVVPSLFAAFFLLLIAKAAGIDAVKAKQWVDSVPFVAEWFDWKKKEKTLANTIETQQQTIKRQNQTIAKQKKQIEQLKSELAAKDEEIARLSTQQQLPTQQEKGGGQASAVDVISMYDAMSDKQAAAILAKLPEDEALEVLSRLDSDKAAAILEQMPAEQAANLLSSLHKWAAREEGAE
ncbi:MotE family protein [Geobacillus sp. WSUCF-018B]|uniref:MotE family protein n=1 Tax=Geobacillus sp. WSUCF-018B TaxID=2055939 RepID=UPI000C28D150|nr:MgtE protein [Geobacillus sp. WSUCF-018B]PJW18996.1 MgtE protein [Geobacillus sp. WSUCF-018B]